MHATSSIITYQRAKTPHSVPKGTALDEPSPHSTRFRMKKTEKTTAGTKKAVSMTLLFHFSPPKPVDKCVVKTGISVITQYKH